LGLRSHLLGRLRVAALTGLPNLNLGYMRVLRRAGDRRPFPAEAAAGARYWQGAVFWGAFRRAGKSLILLVGAAWIRTRDLQSHRIKTPIPRGREWSGEVGSFNHISNDI